MDDQITAIRETIALAKKQERNTGHLAKLLREVMPTLHSAIELPGGDDVDALLDFVVHYIEHVPDFIEAMASLTRQAGIYDYAGTFLGIAQDYFLKPPEVIAEHSGLDALMDEAYLAHRLMEEINDRVIGYCGIPLAPMDMTRANLIVHYLIGEPFANELDLAVQYSVEILMSKEKVFENPSFRDYVQEHRFNGWSDTLQRWPCLAADLAINLNFGVATATSIPRRTH